ncbi:hypothetical protein EDC04DRAFT_1728858 [Pisolithus marmoratus]|nr:hypothetical protein EDC04DRAFT_1728858 [Pisolithus marmoratus]
MRFWFTCRAVTLISKLFNFLTEPDHLIYSFSSLTFANDHKLGWDPTIRRVSINSKTQYRITMHTDEGEPLEYQTTRVISDYNADALRSWNPHLRSLSQVSGWKPGEGCRTCCIKGLLERL